MILSLRGTLRHPNKLLTPEEQQSHLRNKQPRIPLVALIKVAHLGDVSAEDSSPTHDVFRTRVFSTTKKLGQCHPKKNRVIINIAPGTKTKGMEH